MKRKDLTMPVFDNNALYAKEANEKWGDTAAYKDSAEKTKDYSKEKWNEIISTMDSIMSEFAKCSQNGSAPESENAQALVKKWQDIITTYFYTCTDEILAGLGEMYATDERFRTNIDRHGDGTAYFMRDAIRTYTK